jgi:hypothetical protein
MRYNPGAIVAPLAVALTLGCADTPVPVAPEDDSGLAAFLAPTPAAVSAPVFGLDSSPDGSMIAAETFAGVTELRKGSSSLVAALGGVSGVAAIGRGDLLAITGGPLDPAFEPGSRRLYRVSKGDVREIADLGLFENTVNPDQVWNPGPPDSNPFNVITLNGGTALVADAAANAILVVDGNGRIDWVAVLTPQLVSTDPFKTLIGCPGSGAPECGLPAALPAQPVSTSIAVGPDGAYYAGELTGFPGTPGVSRIWRIEPGSRHVICPSAACTQVVGGLNSVVDLAFGPDGTLYAAELDDAGWLAVEILSGGGPLAPVAGGTIKACDIGTGACWTLATGLALPAALTVARDGHVWVAQNSSIPGVASIGPVN